MTDKSKYAHTKLVNERNSEQEQLIVVVHVKLASAFSFDCIFYELSVSHLYTIAPKAQMMFFAHAGCMVCAVQFCCCLYA